MSLKLFLLTFFICISVTNYGQATHVQTHWTWNSTTSGSGTSSSLSHTNTFGSTSTTGNLIVVHVSYSGQVKNISTVTDSKSNSYTKINGPTNWGGVNYYRSELWYAYNISGGSNITITVTMSGSTPMTTSIDGLQFIQIFASEFSGIGTSDPLDQSSVAITSTRPFNSGSVIINYSNELVYGAAIGGTMPAITNGSSFTSLSNQNNNRVEYKNVSSAGTYNADFSSSGNGTAVADMATFITSGSVLPIKLLNFYVSENSGAIDLRWQTTTEINNDYFEVLRSLDGMNWSVIAKIKGAGNSVGIKSYLFSDVSPTMGLNYYRLKQVDFDGNSTLSFVVDAQNSDAHSHAITIVPNPVEDWLTIRNNPSDGQSVYVFNMLGENVTYLISEQTKTNFGFSLNLSLLPEGFYIVKAGQFSEKILKK